MKKDRLEGKSIDSFDPLTQLVIWIVLTVGKYEITTEKFSLVLN